MSNQKLILKSKPWIAEVIQDSRVSGTLECTRGIEYEIIKGEKYVCFKSEETGEGTFPVYFVKDDIVFFASNENWIKDRFELKESLHWLSWSSTKQDLKTNNNIEIDDEDL